MKKILLLLCVCVSGGASAQIITIPDVNFKNALVNTKCVDTDADGKGDVDADVKNAQRFVNYMLASLSHNYGRKGYEFIPKLEDYQSWLGIDELQGYWKINHEKIKWDLKDMKAKGFIRMVVNMKFNSIISIIMKNNFITLYLINN